MLKMHRPIATALALTIALSAVPAFAADEREATRDPQPPRGAAIPALYVSLAALQAYDGWATLQGTKSGAREANGLASPFAGSAPAMWVVKGSLTAGSILAAERLWKSRRRAQAIAVLALTNGIMAAVAARNTQVLREQR
jgi:hypothetical protein